MKPASFCLGMSIFFLFSAPLQAGFFDDLKRQAEKAVQGVTKGVVDGVLPGRKDAGEEKEDPAHSDARPAPSVGNTASAGDAYAEIRAVQVGLKQLGYYKGRPDGKYGKQTRAAIIAYQRDRGMKEDGRVTGRLAKDIQYVTNNVQARAELKEKQKARETASIASKASPARQQSSQLPTFGPFTTELLYVRFNPERYSLDYKNGYYLKQAIQRVYPREWRSIGDEFEQRRKLPELRERLLRDAEKQPLKYRFIKVNSLSRYNFDAQEYLVPLPQLPFIVNRKARWASMKMSPDAAEAFKKRCTGGITFKQCEIYVEVVANIVGSGNGEDTGLFGVLESVRVYNHSTNGGYPDAQLSDLVYVVDLKDIPEDTAFKMYGGEKLLGESVEKDDDKMEISF